MVKVTKDQKTKPYLKKGNWGIFWPFKNPEDGPEFTRWINALGSWKAEEKGGASWRDTPLHGMYHRQIMEVADIKKTYQWL